MAGLCDNPSSAMYDIKMHFSYNTIPRKTMNGDPQIEIITRASPRNIQINNKIQGFEETGWYVIFVTMMYPCGSTERLKIQRINQNQVRLKFLQDDGSGQGDDEKQTFNDGSIIRECHAVGQMTLTPVNSPCCCVGVRVCPVEAKFYIRIKYPSLLEQCKKRGFGCFGV